MAAPRAAAAGHGIQLVTIFQDLAQARAVYGPDRSHTVVSNHTARLFLGGSADPDTLAHASRLIGDTQIEITSDGRDGTGRRTSSTSAQTRPLAPPDLLRGLPRGSAVLVYGDRPPCRIRLRPSFTER